MGRCDVEVQLSERRRHFIQQTGPVQPRYLDHRKTVRGSIVDHNIGDDVERL